MQFDINKTMALLVGALTRPAETWKAYLGENHPWQFTLVNLTAPLLVANVLLSVVFSRWFGTFSAYNLGGNWFLALLQGLFLAALGFAIAVLVINFLAGTFKGEPNFSRAFAAVSLVAIPAWVAGAVGAAIPWLGGLISLAGAIVSLLFLYRILPLALNIPDQKRVVHLVVSIIVIVVINVVIGSVLRIGDTTMPSASPLTRAGRDVVAPSGGMFGEIQRQAALLEQAGEHSYDPPEDGKVSRAQAEWVEEVLTKAQAVVEEEMKKLEKLQKEMDEDKQASPADLARIYQGMGSVVSLNNVEMETVLTDGGNWAEYQWIKQQLRTARIQRGEGSAAIEHNYAIFQEMDEDLRLRF